LKPKLKSACVQNWTDGHGGPKAAQILRKNRIIPKVLNSAHPKLNIGSSADVLCEHEQASCSMLCSDGCLPKYGGLHRTCFTRKGTGCAKAILHTTPGSLSKRCNQPDALMRISAGMSRMEQASRGWIDVSVRWLRVSQSKLKIQIVRSKDLTICNMWAVSG